MFVEIHNPLANGQETARGKIDLAAANGELAELPPLGRIQWARDNFGESLILPTSFGPTSAILLKLASTVMPDIPVVNIRHGYETPKTEKLSRRYRDELFLNLHFYDVPKLPIPREDTPEFADFQRRIKTEPFQRIIDEHRPAAYFSGVMRWQSGSRRDTGFIEHKGSVLAINPILDMTQKQVDEFFLATGLPRNGDYYDPAKGEHQSLECGLHTGVYR